MNNEHKIFNFCRITETIALSGQPATHQFNLIKDLGYSVVFQLVVKEASYSDKDEAYHLEHLNVEHQSMNLSFAAPSIENVQQFLAVMDNLSDQKTLVHCAVGYCSSALMVIYLMTRDNMTFEQAKNKVLPDWSPTPVWKALIEEVTGQDIQPMSNAS